MWLKNKGCEYNQISKRLSVKGDCITDMQENNLYLDCINELYHGNRKGIPKDFFNTVLKSDKVNSYNPIKDYMKNANPCRNGTIDKLISSLRIANNSELSKKFVKKWLVSIIAAMDGHPSPLFLVLCGGVGTGKTRFLRDLLPPELNEYRFETRLEAINLNDEHQEYSRNLLILLDDMDEVLRDPKKEAYIKEITTKDKFNIRKAYGHFSEEYKRLGVFCGSSNLDDILLKSDGNRRIIPIKIAGCINWEISNAIDRNDLFNELIFEYKAGYDYKVIGSEISELESLSVPFVNESFEMQVLRANYTPCDESAPKTITEMIVGIATEYKINNIAQSIQRFSIACKQLGWLPKQINGSKKYNLRKI